MTDTMVHTEDQVIDSPEIAAAIDSELENARYFRQLDTPAEINYLAPVASADLFPGLLGKVVSLCTEHSEAVPVAVAAHTLAWFSAMIGPLRHYEIGDECRWLNDFMLLVGPSGMGKGTSEYGPKKIFSQVEENLQSRFADHWQRGQTDGIAVYPSLDVHEGGLSSGEGLATAKADHLKIGKDEPVIEVTDKRFLIIESEFGNVLNMAERQGNTLSHVLRNGYDGKTIRPLTKRDRVCVTDPYFVMVGNITPGELIGHRQNAVMSVNGMLNRMLILWIHTIKQQPIPKAMNTVRLSAVAEELASCVLFARHQCFETHYRKMAALSQPVRLSPAAEQQWIDAYPELLNMPDCDLVQSLCRRHRLHVLILSSLLALLDQREVIKPDDLTAALAWLDYAKQSVVYAYRCFPEQHQSNYQKQVGEGILRAVASFGGSCPMSSVYQWFNNRIKQEAIRQGVNYCLNFIPPLLTILPIQGQRGRPTSQILLTSEGAQFLASL